MNLMKNFIVFISLAFSVISLSGEVALKDRHVVTFPEITNWKNQPRVEFEQNKKALLKKGQPLKNAFLIKTAALDEIELKLSGGEVLQVFANSRVSVPQISPDTGEVSEIILLEGRVRLKSDNAEQKRLRLKSDFFDFKIPLRLDVFLTIDMKKPSVRIDVVHGELVAVFFDYEQKPLVKEGESLTFNGEREGESIKYDYLLDSRKAPHGVLQPVEKFDVSMYSAQENLQKKLQLQDIEKQKKISAEKLKKKLAYENSFLCKKPFGQKDQCYWQIKNNLCFRLRCNAGGQWGDETERPMNEACANEKVIACDF